MLEFALDEGKPLEAELVGQIAELDRLLIQYGQQTITALPSRLVRADSAKGNIAPAMVTEGSSPPDNSKRAIELVLTTHNVLSALISPATCLSLRATRSERVGWFSRFTGLPAVVQAAILVAILCMIAFIITLPKPDESAREPESTIDGGSYR